MNAFALRLIGAISFSLALVSPLASGASITWSLPQNISGVSDVSTAGSSIGAFNLGNTGVPSTTVNGVTFQSFAVPNNSHGATVGAFTINSAGSIISAVSLGSGSPPFATLPAAYQTLLSTGLGGPPFTLAISGLIVGAQYQSQWWANESTDIDIFSPHTAAAGNSISLSGNTTGFAGGLGQFATGTFTADATSEVISFSGTTYSLVDAFQLRQISAPGVPESGDTLPLLMVAFAAIIFARSKCLTSS